MTERITLLLCLYLLFLRVNSSHGQWREFKPIRFPLSWSSNERRKGLTNGKYCNRLGSRSRLRHAQMTLFTKVTLRIKPGNSHAMKTNLQCVSRRWEERSFQKKLWQKSFKVLIINRLPFFSLKAANELSLKLPLNNIAWSASYHLSLQVTHLRT